MCAALSPLVDAVVARFGRLDALVNNASSFYATKVGAVDTAIWDDLIGSNLKAPFFLAQAAAPHLDAGGGCIVNITDIHAERPLKGYPCIARPRPACSG
jgi:pteridine reductase